MKNKAAVSLGKIGGARNTPAQNEARANNAIAAREARAAKRASLASKHPGRKPDKAKGKG